MRRVRPGTFLLLGAATIALIIDAGYTILIITGKVALGSRSDFVATYLLAAVLAVLAAALAAHRPFYSAVCAASAFAFMGYLAIFTIRLPLLVASACAIAGAIRMREPDKDDWAITILVVLAVFLVGIGGIWATQP